MNLTDIKQRSKQLIEKLAADDVTPSFLALGEKVSASKAAGSATQKAKEKQEAAAAPNILERNVKPAVVGSLLGSAAGVAGGELFDARKTRTEAQNAAQVKAADLYREQGGMPDPAQPLDKYTDPRLRELQAKLAEWEAGQKKAIGNKGFTPPAVTIMQGGRPHRIMGKKGLAGPTPAEALIQVKTQSVAPSSPAVPARLNGKGRVIQPAVPAGPGAEGQITFPPKKAPVMAEKNFLPAARHWAPKMEPEALLGKLKSTPLRGLKGGVAGIPVGLGVNALADWAWPDPVPPPPAAGTPVPVPETKP